MANVLVTGGAGFIGSHLSDYLVNQGHRVTVLDDLSGGFLDNLETPGSAKKISSTLGDVIFVRGSILDERLVDTLFQEGRFEVVYHLAAYAAEGLSHFIKRFNYQNNLIGSVNLINASVNHGVKCFVFTSSMAVYGASQVPFGEHMPPAPEDSYGIAKAAVEDELFISREMFGLDYVIFRPHNVLGERQNIGDRYRNVVGIFMNQILRNSPMTVYGDGEQQRAFSYVGDIIPAIASSPSNPRAIANIFNIGGDEPCTINQLAEMVAEAMDVPLRVVHLDQRHEVKIAYCDHHHARVLLGYQQETPLRKGIARMAAWARQHGFRRGQEFSGIEIEKNLPSFWRKNQ
jgi:UDP-glucose 4-epimerase